MAASIDALKRQLTEAWGTLNDTDTFQEMLEKAGITDDYLAEKIGEGLRILAVSVGFL